MKFKVKSAKFKIAIISLKLEIVKILNLNFELWIFKF